jgi:hypothetical protein
VGMRRSWPKLVVAGLLDTMGIFRAAVLALTTIYERKVGRKIYAQILCSRADAVCRTIFNACLGRRFQH